MGEPVGVSWDRAGGRLLAAALASSWLGCARAPAPTPSRGTLVAPAASSGAIAEPAPCAAVLRLDLERWRRELEAASGAGERDRQLDAMALEAVPDGVATGDDGSERAVAPELVGIDLVPANFGSGPGADRVVHVRYLRQVGDQQERISRVRALRRAGQGWCAIGAALNLDQKDEDRSCFDMGRDWPVQIAVVHLTSPTEHALRWVETSGRCSGCGRAASERVSLHVVSGDRLASVYEATTYDTTYHGCPFPPVKTTLGDLRLSGGHPKEIVATHEIACATEIDEENPRREPCTPEAEERRYRFDGAKYVLASKRPLAAPRHARLAIEDSDFSDARSGAGWHERCVAHLAQGSIEFARAACERGLEARPSREIRARLHRTLAEAGEKDGNVAAACRQLELAQTAEPSDAAAARLRTLSCSGAGSRPKP
jgi:hypothetical protein